MAANHSIRDNPTNYREMVLQYLHDIEQQFNRIDALAFAARRMHEAKPEDDQTDATLFGMIEHEVEERTALIRLRDELDRLLPVA